MPTLTERVYSAIDDWKARELGATPSTGRLRAWRRTHLISFRRGHWTYALTGRGVNPMAAANELLEEVESWLR